MTSLSYHSRQPSVASSMISSSTLSTGSNSQHPQKIGPWTLGKTLGRGATGRVLLATNNKTGQKAAVKVVSKSILNDDNEQIDKKGVDTAGLPYGIEREIIIMKLLTHPNVLRLYDVWETSKALYLVLEYVEGGELFDLLVEEGPLPEKQAIKYFRQIVMGAAYCHALGICHRDLKPENLLLDGNLNVKLADFGMAALESNGRLLETSCGSPHYAAPEIVSGLKYHGAASDVWSCGVILFALLTGRLPFDDENIRNLLLKVQAGSFDMPNDISKEAKDLLSHMLTVDPMKRIKTEKVLTHALLNKYPPSKEDLSNFQNLPHPETAYKSLGSKSNIDKTILQNLTILWHGRDEEEIIDNLLIDGPNPEKTFYALLLRYRNNQQLDQSNQRTPRRRSTLISTSKSMNSISSRTPKKNRISMVSVSSAKNRPVSFNHNRGNQSNNNSPHKSPYRSPHKSPRKKGSSRFSNNYTVGQQSPSRNFRSPKRSPKKNHPYTMQISQPSIENAPPIPRNIYNDIVNAQSNQHIQKQQLKQKSSQQSIQYHGHYQQQQQQQFQQQQLQQQQQQQQQQQAVPVPPQYQQHVPSAQHYQLQQGQQYQQQVQPLQYQQGAPMHQYQGQPIQQYQYQPQYQQVAPQSLQQPLPLQQPQFQYQSQYNYQAELEPAPKHHHHHHHKVKKEVKQENSDETLFKKEGEEEHIFYPTDDRVLPAGTSTMTLKSSASISSKLSPSKMSRSSSKNKLSRRKSFRASITLKRNSITSKILSRYAKMTGESDWEYVDKSAKRTSQSFATLIDKIFNQEDVDPEEEQLMDEEERKELEIQRLMEFERLQFEAELRARKEADKKKKKSRRKSLMSSKKLSIFIKEDIDDEQSATVDDYESKNKKSKRKSKNEIKDYKNGRSVSGPDPKKSSKIFSKSEVENLKRRTASQPVQPRQNPILTRRPMSKLDPLWSKYENEEIERAKDALESELIESPIRKHTKTRKSKKIKEEDEEDEEESDDEAAGYAGTKISSVSIPKVTRKSKHFTNTNKRMSVLSLYSTKSSFTDLHSHLTGEAVDDESEDGKKEYALGERTTYSTTKRYSKYSQQRPTSELPRLPTKPYLLKDVRNSEDTLISRDDVDAETKGVFKNIKLPDSPTKKDAKDVETHSDKPKTGESTKQKPYNSLLTAASANTTAPPITAPKQGPAPNRQPLSELAENNQRRNTSIFRKISFGAKKTLDDPPNFATPLESTIPAEPARQHSIFRWFNKSGAEAPSTKKFKTILTKEEMFSALFSLLNTWTNYGIKNLNASNSSYIITGSIGKNNALSMRSTKFQIKVSSRDSNRKSELVCSKVRGSSVTCDRLIGELEKVLMKESVLDT